MAVNVSKLPLFCIQLPELQGEQAQARPVRINGEQRAFFQLRCHLPQGHDDLLADHVRADIVGADLHDAGLLAVGGGEDRAEVQIVGKHHVVVDAGVGHDFRVRRVARAKR